MLSKNLRVRVALLGIVGLGMSAAVALGQVVFEVDQKIEVREGDTWSPATSTKKAGRRFQIQYDDGSDEWVTADRMRAPAGGAAAEPATGPAPAVKPAPKAPPEKLPVTGQKAEYHDGWRWQAGTVKQRDTELFLIEPERGSGHQMMWMWVPAESVRFPATEKQAPAEAMRPVRVGMDGIPKSKIEAKRQLVEHKAKATAAAKSGGEKPARNDPFAPKPYDKPVSPAVRDNLEEMLASGGAATLGEFDTMPPTLKLTERAYVLRGKGDAMGTGPSDFLVAGKQGVVVYHGRNGGDTVTRQIERLDLASGQNNGVRDFDPLSNPIAISPSGNRLIGRAHGFFPGTKNRVDLWDTKTAEPKHLISFEPYIADGPASKANADVAWAALVDDEHLLTLNPAGSLILWKAATATAVWRMTVAGSTIPAISPGGNQIAVMTSDGAVVISPIDGKVLCQVDGARSVSSLAFTPDGKRVVGSTGTIVCFWDFEKGEMTADIGVPIGTGGEPLAVSGSHILLGGSDLLDLDRKAIVWRYTGASGRGGATVHGTLCYAVVRDGERTVLTGATIPHASAAKVIAAAPPTTLLVRPGTTVSLEVAIEGTEEQRAKIAEAMTAQLQANGIKVAANQPIKLIAKTEQGKTETRTYERRSFGFGGPPAREVENVSVTEKITRVYFDMNGTVAWENRTTSTAPWHLSSKAGESIGQTVSSANQFNLAFLESVRVPAYVAVPSEKVGFGTSRWSIGGVKDEK